MRVYLTPCKDRVVIEGEVPVLLGQRGTPGGYEIQLTWTQALSLVATLEQLAKQIEPVSGNGVSAGPAPESNPMQPVAPQYDDD